MNREALIKHWEVIEAYKDGKPIEWFNDKTGRWLGVNNPIFEIYSEYRVKLTPDKVPWDVLNPKWKWYARHRGGARFLFVDKPALCENAIEWRSTRNGCKHLDPDVFDLGEFTCDWKDSLQKRP